MKWSMRLSQRSKIFWGNRLWTEAFVFGTVGTAGRTAGGAVRTTI